MTSSEDKAIFVIIGVCFLVITIISALIGYYINEGFGIGAFIFGILIVIVPAVWFFREMSKPDNTDAQRSRS